MNDMVHQVAIDLSALHDCRRDPAMLASRRDQPHRVQAPVASGLAAHYCRGVNGKNEVKSSVVVKRRLAQ